MKTLDISTCELTGTNLIEASAGTGKTYTIAALFLRLVVEKNIPPEKILVVTFTRAAVEELRDRLYRVLQAARDSFNRSDSCSEPFINLIKENQSCGRAEKIERVSRALRDFDECAISTIHGFCQRMLRENVFSGGALSDPELISDQTELLLDAIQDFWRVHIYPAPRCIMGYLLKNGLELFLDLYKFKERNPDLCLAVPPALPSARELEESFAGLKKLGRELKENWPADPTETMAWFELERKILDGKSYQKKHIESAARAIHEFCMGQTEIIDQATRDKLTKFTVSELKNKSKQGEIPGHAFFQLADRLAQQYDSYQELAQGYLIGLKARMFAYVRTRLAERKKKDNIQSFNDFILGLRTSLAGPEGGRLGQAIRKRFSVALIDEFQDTDPSQYAIFSTLFSKADLFLIGDPKQAIYSFRGADVYAYLRAAAQVKKRYTLATNYRSDDRLVRGVNALFDRMMSANPFAEPDISFQEVKAAVKDSPLTIEGEEDNPALTIWTLDGSSTEDKAITATAAREYLNQAVVSEIHRLLTLASQGRATLREHGGLRSLRPADFAILTRSRKEMPPLRNLLIRQGIPCVTSSADSIFDTEEAGEMALLLQALAAPGSERALKAALAQTLFGLDGRDLQDLGLDPLAWEKWALAFQRFHDLFSHRGFLGMFRTMLRELKIKERLLSRRDGERHLTNLLHLAEILHQRQTETGAGPQELLNWFAACCAEPRRREEELELRMEGDDNAVQIVTIHKSKGLEYPIVFAPFVWGDSESRYPLCHNEQGDMTLFLDPRQFAGQQAAAFREALSENLRLFYVALTRARHRGYTFWGKLTYHSRSHTSAPSYLFLGGDQLLSGPEPAKALKDAYNELQGHDDLQRYLKTRLAHARDYVAVEALPRASARPLVPGFGGRVELRAAAFSRPMPQTWQIASFSMLSRHGDEPKSSGPEETFPGSSPARQPRQNNEFTIFTFPRGARPGTFLHGLLENLDFCGRFGDDLKQNIRIALERSGFAPDFAPAVRRMLRDVVNQPLDGFSLSQVDKDNRLDEMEFYFPLKKITAADLAETFKEAVSRDSICAMFSQGAERLTFSPIHGYMHGFIDLVFCHQGRWYLIDWKSNYLGASPDDYTKKAVIKAMNDHFYFLQYHIYTMALHLYLVNRLPDYNYEEHFGGVYYLFLRGIAPPGDTGVYFHKPSLRVLEELCRIVKTP